MFIPDMMSCFCHPEGYTAKAQKGRMFSGCAGLQVCVQKYIHPIPVGIRK